MTDVLSEYLSLLQGYVMGVVMISLNRTVIILLLPTDQEMYIGKDNEITFISPPFCYAVDLGLFFSLGTGNLQITVIFVYMRFINIHDVISVVLIK